LLSQKATHFANRPLTSPSPARANGNPNQWNGAYPDPETLRIDIEKQRLYVYKKAGSIHGVFMLLLEEEPTYAYIEDGSWREETPYGTIHLSLGDIIDFQNPGQVCLCCRYDLLRRIGAAPMSLRISIAQDVFFHDSVIPPFFRKIESFYHIPSTISSLFL